MLLSDPPIAYAVVGYIPTTEEWVVRAYGAKGERLPNSDYFTNDRGDAITTAKLMKEINHD